MYIEILYCTPYLDFSIKIKNCSQCIKNSNKDISLISISELKWFVVDEFKGILAEISETKVIKILPF